MILNSKQLEELENIQDASGEFEEEAGDSDGYVEGVENALAWRRGMIERAVVNIRKLVRKPMESMEGLASGSLVYLKESKRFVRIHENQDGHSELSFVSPTPSLAAQAKSEKQAKAAKAGKPLKEKKPAKVEQPAQKSTILKPAAVKAPVAKAAAVKVAPPKPVATKEVVKAKAKPEPKAKAKTKTKAKVEAPKAKAKAPAKKADKKVEKKPAGKLKSATKTKKVSLKKEKKAEKPALKSKPKKATPQKAVTKSKAKPAKKLVDKKKHKKSALSSRPYSSNVEDPVADPNGYIRGNFRLMSNKELSHVTGLSEHTIRRKLGEWGLKRI